MCCSRGLVYLVWSVNQISPRSLLEMYNASPNPSLLSQNLRFFKIHRLFVWTLKFEKHCSRTLGDLAEIVIFTIRLDFVYLEYWEKSHKTVSPGLISGMSVHIGPASVVLLGIGQAAGCLKVHVLSPLLGLSLPLNTDLRQIHKSC